MLELQVILSELYRVDMSLDFTVTYSTSERRTFNAPLNFTTTYTSDVATSVTYTLSATAKQQFFIVEPGTKENYARPTP